MDGNDRLLARLTKTAVDLREGEGAALLLSFAYFFCLLSGYSILRPLRDEMGIAAGVQNLQWLFAGTFVVMLAAVPAYAWLVARYPRRVFMPLVYRFFILNILIFFVLFEFAGQKELTARAFFIWVSVFNLFVVSVFWSFMADLFRNDQGRRLFGFIAAGGTTGAFAGPAITLTLVDWLGPVPLLLVSAIFLELAVRCIHLLRRHAPRSRDRGTAADETIGGGLWSGITDVARSPYLRQIGLYIALISAAGTFLYFIQANIVADALDDPAARTRVFATIDLAANILTIGIQVLLTGRFIRRFGLPAALAFLPVISLLGFAVVTAAATISAIAVVQACQRAANFAISNPAREILFTVLSPEQKYKCKNVADTVIFRGADMLSGFAFAGLRDLGFGLSGIAVTGGGLALFWIAAAWRLGRAQDKVAESDRKGIAGGKSG